jgi:phage tail-like protein
MTSLHFKVSWGDSENTMSFSEVSGLTMEAEAIEYRVGDDKSLTVRKIPGLKKFGNVSLKRGIMPAVSGNGMYEWYDSIQAGTVLRRQVLISLLNEKREEVMSWKIKAAWPVKLEGPGLNATGNEIAIESLEFANEGVEIELSGAG